MWNVRVRKNVHTEFEFENLKRKYRLIKKGTENI
jgi:hypothetical protein